MLAKIQILVKYQSSKFWSKNHAKNLGENVENCVSKLNFCQNYFKISKKVRIHWVQNGVHQVAGCLPGNFRVGFFDSLMKYFLQL